MLYWLVSLPVAEPGAEAGTWRQLQEVSCYQQDLAVNFKFDVPAFRSGTLDSLLGLSDDLTKVNAAVEGTVNKIRRQLFDVQAGVPPEDRADVWVEGMTPEGYLQRFAWNEAKYPSRRPLKDTVAAVTDTIQKLDDDLKVKVTEYSQLKSALQAVARKQTGSLAVRDLSDVVPPGAIVDTENLCTLLVVVAKSARADWLMQYERMAEFVVPRSTAAVAEDGDYVVFTVVLFKRVADNFKTAARSRGFQVKEVAPPAAADACAGEGLERLAAGAEAKRAALEQWCITSYGEAFSGWIHLTAVRLFVESVLRYGLPPRFLAALVRPAAKHAGRLRKLLAQHFSGAGAEHFTSEAGADDSIQPYVNFTLNLSQ